MLGRTIRNWMTRLPAAPWRTLRQTASTSGNSGMSVEKQIHGRSGADAELFRGVALIDGNLEISGAAPDREWHAHRHRSVTGHQPCERFQPYPQFEHSRFHRFEFFARDVRHDVPE